MAEKTENPEDLAPPYSSVDPLLEDQEINKPQSVSNGNNRCRKLRVFIAIAALLVFLSTIFTPCYRNTIPISAINLDDEEILLNTPDPALIRSYSNIYTSDAHLAGQNLELAKLTAEKYREFGLEAEIVHYDIYLNYPLGHRLALLNDDESVKFEASLEEDVLPEDPTTGFADRIPTFHGYSASGNVTAELVYVNFGRDEDYKLLDSKNVDLDGKIAIAKYGKIARGLKVKGAQDRGAIGVILYSDPQEDGPITEDNGYEAYPEGPARNPSSVQRGSVMFFSLTPGDPTTPGWPSKHGVERVSPYETIPKIPSLPISYRDAIPLLKSLNGKGLDPKDLGDDWTGKLKNVDYNIGPSDLKVNLFNDQNYTITPVYNVIGKLEGHVPYQAIVLGNHRDSWIVGGAGDPNSGSAVQLEVARSFGELAKTGWKPLRTMIFASWDGEEYGLLGSTEWGEDNEGYISEKVLAYLNVDVAVSGDHFRAESSPLLEKAIKGAAQKVPHPKGGSIYDHWSKDSNATVKALGSGSDFSVFLDHLGVASLDLGFSSTRDSPVYHYHSNYDSFHWMDTYGDPKWEYHAALAKLWGLIALSLHDEVVNFGVTEYSEKLYEYLDPFIDAKLPAEWVESADKKAILKSLLPHCAHGVIPKALIEKLDKVKDRKLVAQLAVAILEFADAATTFDERAQFVQAELDRGFKWFEKWKLIKYLTEVRGINRKYFELERVFLFEEGLDGRSWYRHTIFAPKITDGYSAVQFPGLAESLDANDEQNFKRWALIILGQVRAATKLITL